MASLKLSNTKNNRVGLSARVLMEFQAGVSSSLSLRSSWKKHEIFFVQATIGFFLFLVVKRELDVCLRSVAMSIERLVGFFASIEILIIV